MRLYTDALINNGISPSLLNSPSACVSALTASDQERGCRLGHEAPGFSTASPTLGRLSYTDLLGRCWPEGAFSNVVPASAF